MANQPYTRLQRSYPVLETTYGVVPGSHPVNGDCCLIISLTDDPVNPEIDRPDKTGSFGEIVGIPGRRSATWSASLSAAANGATGVKPDCDEYLALALGITGDTSVSNVVTYRLADTCPSASIFDYNAPATETQFVLLGAICNRFSTSFGGDVPILNFSGEAMWVYDSLQAADSNTEAAAKGGLSGAFPAEPSAPVVNGTPPQGFSGLITLDSNTYTSMRTGMIDCSFLRELQKDGFNQYPVAPGAGTRSINISFEVYDDDSSNLNALKTKALSPTYPLENLSFQIGKVAGNIWTWTVKNVRLIAPVYDKGNSRRTVKFSGKAHDTSIGSNDALTLVIT